MRHLDIIKIKIKIFKPIEKKVIFLFCFILKIIKAEIFYFKCKLT